MMRFSKSALLVTTALICAPAAPASAQSSVPANFAGFYFGTNIGYSWGTAKIDAFDAPFSFTTPFGLTYQGGTTSTTLHPNGLVGGGQVGYNWYIAPAWLFGFEADFQWTGQRDSGQGLLLGVVNSCTFGVCNFSNLTDVTAKLSWFGTVRGSVGPQFNNLWFYLTGGLAYGNVSVSGVNIFSLTSGGSYDSLAPFSFSTTRVGWTGGFGIAGKITGSNWSWKIEFLHLDFGSFSGGSFGQYPNVTINVVKFTDEIVRVGLNLSLP